MTDYTELVKALRICSNELNCGDCPLLYRDSCSSDELMTDAADAIEELIESVHIRDKHLDELNHYIWELEAQLPKRGKWVREKAPEENQSVFVPCLMDFPSPYKDDGAVEPPVAVQAASEDEPVMDFTFTVKNATQAHMEALTAFLEENGYEYALEV